MKRETYPIPGDRYEHYKGGIYEIISMATHTETQEKMIVYKSLNFGSVYVRPYAEFTKNVELPVVGSLLTLSGGVRFEKIS